MSEEEPASLKLWITKTIGTMAILIALVAVIQQYFGFNILTDVIISFIIILLFFFSHEFLHYYKAIKLGYKDKITWYRTRMSKKTPLPTMGFEIDISLRKHRDHKLAIGKFPYYFMFPAAFLLLIIGYILSNISISITAIVIIVFHVISYFTTEGKV